MPENKSYGYNAADIERYLNGRMNAQEMHELERAALSDPMLADAIDGFRLVSGGQTAKQLNAIHAAILGQVENQKTAPVPLSGSGTRTWRWIAAACVLGLLATSIWWFNRPGTSRSDIAQVQQPAAPVIGDSPVMTEAAQKDATDSSPVMAPLPPPTVLASRRQQAASPVETATAPVEDQTNEQAAIAANTTDKEDLRHFQQKKTAVAARVQTQTVARSGFQDSLRPPQPSAQAVAFNYIAGRVTDEQGKPVAAATIEGAQQTGQGILSGKDGSFVFPAADSQPMVSISSPGYARSLATLKAEKNNQIALTRVSAQNEEMLVVGAGSPKKRKGVLGDYNKFRKETAAAQQEYILYPEEGWSHFYQELAGNLGVDSSRSTRMLQIKFTVDEDGEPTNFSIVASPDEITARKAIEYIKKVKWKNFKLNKSAVVRIPVN
ncbi:hypothetical protein GCM10027051_15400 [Niabella terrae]